MHLILDPIIFRVPSFAGMDDATKYLATLSLWVEVLVENSGKWSLSELATNAILDEGEFPTWDRLANLIAISRDESFSVPDLLNLLRRISETRPFIEERIGVSQVACDGHVIVPEVLLERLGARIGSAFGDGLFLTACVMTDGWDIEVLGVGTPQPVADSDHVDVKVAHVCAQRRDDVVVATWHDVAWSFPIEVQARRLVADVKWNDVYRDVDRAVGIVYDELVPTSVRNGRVRRSILPGPLFLESLDKYHIHNQPAILRRVYERLALAEAGLLSGVPGARLHDVRQGEGANERQVVRGDGAKLWRCMVTKDGAGFRLQYWQLADGTIEAQAVMVEGDVIVQG